MPYSYIPLWNTLNKYSMGKYDLCERVGLSSSTMAKMTNNQKVSMDVLARICDYFACGLNDVVEYHSEMELFMQQLKNRILDCSYTVYADEFPEYRFLFSDFQMQRLAEIDYSFIQSELRKSEMIAVDKHPTHTQIVGTTTYAVQSSANLIVMQGSLTVVELFMKWLLDQITC